MSVAVQNTEQGYILAIDTALESCSVGLFEYEGYALKSKWIDQEAMTRGHQEALGAACQRCFDKSGIEPKQLTAIITTLGPGSFTGLRVGLSFAKGMAAGLDLKLKGISTLEAIGQAKKFKGYKRIVAQDGGRGVIYVLFIDETELSSGIKAIDINDSEAFKALEAAQYLIGNGGVYLKDRIPNCEVIPMALPDLEAMSEATISNSPSFDDLTPIYMRDADAKVSSKPAWAPNWLVEL
jgi:tRNA threonylcarbamoyladenosine biosynthesis protein TsaB